MTQEINLGGERRAENIRPVNPFEYKPVEKRESPAARNALAETLQDESLSPRTALDLLIHFEDEINVERISSLPELSEVYGFDLNEIPEDRLLQLALTYSEANRTDDQKAAQELKSVFDRKLHEQLVESALDKIDILSKQLGQNLNDPETIKSSLRNILDRMGSLSKQIPISEPNNVDLWKKMYDSFKGLVDIKLTDARTSRIFSEIFQEYSNFIDDEFAMQAFHQFLAEDKGYDVEDAMQLTYGRTRVEIEEIKVQNRIQSVKEIKKLSAQDYLTVDDIIHLHRTNNKGITPQAFSRLRVNEMEHFGLRVGTMPDDLAEEMNLWEQRVNLVIQQSQDEAWTDIRYQIAVAQLHNQLLDIHPFLDRNGSTSLLFMELMMARRNYDPQKERERDFYKTVRKALSNNPVAIGLVAYEMGLISYVPGYYKGETTKGRHAEYRKAVVDLFKSRIKKKYKNPPE
ncbi:MAG: Fic family protein [Patescibacteria group bacterium]|nr:Fic family protein [Patescibacteria group bacterium]